MSTAFMLVNELAIALLASLIALALSASAIMRLRSEDGRDGFG